MPIDCNRGEERHQSLKRNMASSCRRTAEVVRHLARRTNVALALQYVRDGLVYEARCYRQPHGWETILVTPTQNCKDALDAMADMLPLTPGKKRERVSKPRRSARWQGRVRSGAVVDSVASAQGENDAWKSHVSRFAPRESDLVRAYGTWFGCSADDASGAQCVSNRCPRCWDTPDELHDTDIACHNVYVPRSGIEDLRADGVVGAAVKKFGEGDDDTFWLGASGGDDVQFRRDPADATRRPIGRVLYFFEHRSNTRVGGPPGQGDLTTWAVVLQFKSVGIGTTLQYDKATDMAIFSMQKTVDLFPATEISHVIHMAHACHRAGMSRCSLSSGTGTSTWQHAYHRNRKFLRNENFRMYEG